MLNDAITSKMLSVIMLSVVVMLSECRYAESRHAECRHAECCVVFKCFLINDNIYENLIKAKQFTENFGSI